MSYLIAAILASAAAALAFVTASAFRKNTLEAVARSNELAKWVFVAALGTLVSLWFVHPHPPYEVFLALDVLLFGVWYTATRFIQARRNTLREARDNEIKAVLFSRPPGNIN